MTKIFADTGFWIALLSPRDELHSNAVLARAAFRIEQIITSELVLTELVNHFSASGSIARRKASQIWVRAHSEITVIPSSQNLMKNAMKEYTHKLDKEWSLTDCVSFTIMRERDITDALTHDHHFEQAGFRILL